MNDATAVWLNGALLPESEARLSIFDRGFTLGDGIFETMRVREGRPLWLADHLARLREGAAVLGIPVPLDDRFERALLPMMAEFHVRHIEGRGAESSRFAHHLLGGDEMKLGLGIDELPNQPRTCDAIDFHFFARDPFHDLISFGAETPNKKAYRMGREIRSAPGFERASRPCHHAFAFSPII